MAEVDLKKLTNLEALKDLADRVNKGFATKTELKTVENKLDGIASQGGEPNVLEEVKVNGETLNIAEEDKSVDILIKTGESDGSIKVNDKDVPVKGLNALAYKDKVSEDNLNSDLVEKIDDKVDTESLTELENKVTTLIGEDDNKSVRTIAIEELAKQLLSENAEDALESLKKLAKWIEEHPGEAEEMNSEITELKELIGDIPKEADSDNIVEYITEVVDAAIEELNIS